MKFRMQYTKKYEDLFNANDSMRQAIIKNCPSLLKSFDEWVIFVDPNINDPLRRSKSSWGSTRFSENRSRTQINYAFFNRQHGDPSHADILAHEFRHTMKVNFQMFRPGDEFRDPKVVPGEIDANKWAQDFWSNKCDCRN
ncbi:hypothetical protein [Ottowia testudinis]|uniref:Uncharacterized protein n=1 Tax=Ottowia testudinis TaxID=2816950 RepID=A0A975CIV4_9BURK|nr:hypothetical protein [Ottowia testudinis]QTD46389.1 hypothetical protein J1M35_05735 [Ottowia testudinis]